ncbi:tRNA (guanosine(37)-N1)-methyltransferase TrmD [Candidatus Berkelbacteria bacterium CG_4_10_14_0_8_um_filter_35_9_33_8]|uniref:tRNA (guanine-N(1)-)-methyltransferase n=1 Tax=Candidatus Berkelbacteria bacterium CG_4_10_14_0_2_um_filter_35_9_33_12 TaxID=1974499 RepID=A0A2M7W3J1_9BACT|nr:MAG: tRNA (guanosine(37)-N1)-methyltransferase TrmD [Candidatus Berkelbacteria bacterium CG23_combo_of_CG06-09_8_20_14_all_33_15]PIS08403.1 MAG: tRNA (guanosine(37)-N1)-methyltransferase TrmD [Candidatus Berkelbacteria bacterium CG10_big_fil_rev_8_21_14_0_10_33_10]PIZ27929.1 MAG: tRNA (guanosine(37)-N1)-methyltransferase TrmD [Candidatus Berkelbacteria bacterium CG_4_10_14_0_8_um_filter_35_9_33_8]PJA20086.1 MAG: tRNA (guanosine(37)-N1)-methyltransferase TrmD [Candidatus Berkelbacteria bacteri
MKIFYIVSLFPDFLQSFKNHSMIYRAEKNKIIKIIPIDLRKFGINKRKTVDGTPAGGGGGMILRVDVIVKALESIKKKDKNLKVILLDPRGKIFNQKKAISIAQSKHNLVLICGHYEGVDERINDYVDEKISIGKYVLTGGEIPAMTIIDAVSRNIKRFFGNKTPYLNESFTTDNYLEYPQYTKPNEFEGKKIPEILLSGNHREIKDWRNDV